MSLPVVEREPCQCHECVVAGASKLNQRLDPYTREWMHGKALVKWWQARRDYEARMAQVFKTIKRMK